VPISAECNPRDRIWTLTTGESFTLDEVADLVRTTDWRGGKRYLWDLRRLRSGPDSSSDLHQAVDFLKRGRPLWDGSRTAIVVTRDFDFGIARMFQVYAEGVGIEYQIFRDPEAATEWLLAPSAP
jgi:hypothetical protein